MKNLNWCYGAKKPTQNAELVDEQIRLAHVYKNKLTEIERERRVVAEMYARQLSPAFEAAKAHYDACDEKVTAAYDALKASRSNVRKRVEPTAEQQLVIDNAKEIRKEASAALKKVKAAAYKAVTDSQAPFHEMAKSIVVYPPGVSDKQKKDILKEQYLQLAYANGVDAGEFQYSRRCKEERKKSGLYWGTYLTAEAALVGNRKGAPPKFKRYEGNGSVAVQIQGGIPFAEAIECESTLLRLYIPKTERMAVSGKDSGKQAVGEAWVRVQSTPKKKPVWAVIPFVYHREIPNDAVIKWSYIDRVKVGSEYQHTLRLAIVTRTERHPAPPNENMVAVHIGYRKMKGGLRVATWIGTDGESGDLVIPDAEVKKFLHPYELNSIRDGIANEIYDEFIAWLKSVELSEWMAEETATIAQWKSPNSLNRLAEQWRDNQFEVFPKRLNDAGSSMPAATAWARMKLKEYQSAGRYNPVNPDDLQTVFGVMQFWRRFDKHLLNWSANASAKCRDRRENFYRKFAKDLREKYKTLAIAKIDWKGMRVKEDSDEKVTTTVEQRRVASLAAPGRLSEIVHEAFSGDIVEVSSVDVTRDCHVCKKKHDFDRLLIKTTCRHCGSVWDQDVNGARNAITRANAKKTDKSDAPAAKKVAKARRNRRAVPVT